MDAHDALRTIAKFAELSMRDVAEVGGKNASLGEMVANLAPRGVRIPDGFAITATAFRRHLRDTGLEDRLRALFAGLDLDDVADLQRRGRDARDAVLAAPLPAWLTDAIGEAWRALGSPSVAVRSSATAEDLPEASFAGQQETFLNVHGLAALHDAVRRCFASLYTDRAISYRAEHGYGQLDVALSVGVQRMVRSDLACAGVMFTLDTESGFRDVVLISAAYGLGENVVQGAVVPDEYLVFKPTLHLGHRPIVRRRLGTKALRMVYDEGGGRLTRNVAVPPAEQGRFALSEDEVLALARQACLVEEHYAARRGSACPMDLEWAKDGLTGELFIVQARPETVHARRKPGVERYVLDGQAPVALTGRAIGERIASGPARVLASVADLRTFRDGEILVAERTDPDWEPVMRRAAAIVTASGGRTCHAAIVSRELGIPAIVGAVGATARLAPGAAYTVDCAAGEEGRVLEGAVPFHVERTDAVDLPRPRTRVMMNVADPAEAFRLAGLPNDGVGLLREEFVVLHTIGIHPMALAAPERVPPEVRAEIAERIAPWTDGPTFFVDKLAEGIGTIAAAFYPKDVIVRFSDFKTNEYARLLGGAPFEPREENPMIGFRGASRYAHPAYRAAFALECRALNRVRDVMGLTNVKGMIPFVRTLDEAAKVVAELAANGLVRGDRGFALYAMCEVPSTAILAERFGAFFDGFSIGSNDLTQLVLGVDRDSGDLASLFDESDPAVMWAIGAAVAGAHRAGRPIGICGQAPSDRPAFAAELVRLGIDSISLTPDSVIAGTQRILDAERGA